MKARDGLLSESALIPLPRCFFLTTFFPSPSPSLFILISPRPVSVLHSSLLLSLVCFGSHIHLVPSTTTCLVVCPRSSSFKQIHSNCLFFSLFFLFSISYFLRSTIFSLNTPPSTHSPLDPFAFTLESHISHLTSHIPTSHPTISTAVLLYNNGNLCQTLAFGTLRKRRCPDQCRTLLKYCHQCYWTGQGRVDSHSSPLKFHTPLRWLPPRAQEKCRHNCRTRVQRCQDEGGGGKWCRHITCPPFSRSSIAASKVDIQLFSFLIEGGKWHNPIVMLFCLILSYLVRRFPSSHVDVVFVIPHTLSSLCQGGAKARSERKTKRD